MASRRFNPIGFLMGVLKFILGVVIALFIIGLAGAATARYFLTQLSTLPERPVYENDASQTAAAPKPQPEITAPAAAAPQAEKPQAPEPDDTVLFKAVVTYGGGLLIRSGAGDGYETVDGIDYNDTVDVLEESGRWYRIRTSSGLEGWIKGRDNTQRL